MEKNQVNGRSRITAAFAKTKQSQSAALMPYFTLGFPDIPTSLAVVEAIAPASDLLELGIPFSDPLADGPTIQRSTQIALENGTTTAVCLDLVRQLRQRGVETPVLLMGYYNPVLAYGVQRLVQEAAAAGVDGFIIPDLPLEEATEMETAVRQAGLVLVYFLAPTSNPQRMERVVAQAQGFIYLVSLVGVTGARNQVENNLAAFIARVRSKTEIPLAVGFGIATPEQAAQVGQLADGVIVGSALIAAVDKAEEKVGTAVQFVQSLRQALLK